jgi:hypothetical protein
MYLIINGKPPSQTEKKYVAVHLNELLLFISNPAIFCDIQWRVLIDIYIYKESL